eukprot:TRINITY_DN19197_c0_g1_i4.p1 TRINITY_DN19197_c0_g1~~TRINITY_DN19197_c0_g1_i4.p1  ORF type:complete len:186 (-),score=20.14 TRINITY_DN19197_c0_g1_i4:946-1503(-)
MDFVWKLWCMEFIFLVGAMGGLPLAVCQEQQADFLWPVPRVLRTLPADIINDATSFVPSDSLRERDEAVASDLPAGAAFLAAVLRVASLQLNPLDAVQFFAYRYQFDLVIREQLASFVCERLACPKRLVLSVLRPSFSSMDHLHKAAAVQLSARAYSLSRVWPRPPLTTACQPSIWEVAGKRFQW